MNKYSIIFRSWDSDLQRFFYFKNGKYYFQNDFKEECYAEVFDWNNADAFYGVHDKNYVMAFKNDVTDLGTIEYHVDSFIIGEDCVSSVEFQIIDHIHI